MITVLEDKQDRTLVVQVLRDNGEWQDYWTGSPGDTIDWVEDSVMPNLLRETPDIELRLVEIVTTHKVTAEVVS